MREDNNGKVKQTERFSPREQRFSKLKVEFKKRPAFLDELKNYEKREQYDLDDQ